MLFTIFVPVIVKSFDSVAIV